MVTQAAFEHYKLGIPNLDAEHWMLISTMAEVNRLVKEKYIPEAKALLDSLAVLLKNHCEAEEKFMAEINYPYRTYHATAHEAIIKKVQRAMDELNDDSPDYAIKSFTNTLHDVFVTHIDSYDMQIAAYVEKQKGKV